MAQTLLTYAINPTSVPATQESGTDNKRTFVITATNPNQTAVTLTSLSITLPIGLNAPDLSPAAPNLPSISPNPQPTEWNTPSKTVVTGHVTYTFDPTSNFPHGVQVGSQALTIAFEDVPITSEVGTADIVVTEGSPNSPTTTLTVSKFPNVWSQTSFNVSPSIAYDSTPTLWWEGGPVDATYYLTYWTAQTGAVRYPKTGSLGSSGTYPGTGPKAPKLKLTADTVFNLWVSKQMAPNSNPVVMQLQKTVVVRQPPAPQIISFTADPRLIKSGVPTNVDLTWKTRNTSVVKLSSVGGYRGVSPNDPAIRNEPSQLGDFKPNDHFTVTPSESTLYTITAYGLEGYQGQPKTANVQVTSTPQITKFTGEIQTSDGVRVSLVLNWNVLYVTECKISGVSEISLSPIGSRTITPSVSHPLQTTYTLTATNPAGTATSQLTVVWGKQALATTKVEQPMGFGIAVSPDGTLIYVANVEKNGVSVLDATTLQPVGEPVVSSNPIVWDGSSYPAKSPWGIAVSSPKSAKSPFYSSNVFVTNSESNSLLVLSTAEKEPKIKAYANATALGKRPMGVAVSPDGTRVYVANNDDLSLSVLDVKTFLPITGTPVPVGSYPVGIAVSPDGSRVFVANNGDGTVSVLDATADPIKVVGKPIPVGMNPAGITVLPDGSRVVVANNGENTVSVLDATANPIRVIGKPIKVEGEPLGLAITPNGDRVFVLSNTNNTVTILNTTTDPISVVKPSFKVNKEGGTFYGVAMSPDGARLFVGNLAASIVSIIIPTSVTGGIGN